jgi:hypothetical protein
MQFQGEELENTLEAQIEHYPDSMDPTLVFKEQKIDNVDYDGYHAKDGEQYMTIYMTSFYIVITVNELKMLLNAALDVRMENRNCKGV